MAKRILEGDTLDDLIEEDPGFVLLHAKQIKEFVTLHENSKKRKRDKDPMTFELVEGGTEALQVVAWLNSNIRKPREFKQKQLWLWSNEPNMGKTSLAIYLDSLLSVIWWQKFEDFDCAYQDGAFDLAILDEFKGQRRLQYMNEVLQGGPTQLRQKNGRVMKRDRLPFIILSNYPPAGAYPNLTEDSITLLEARLTVIQLTSFIKIKKI
jgi:hypothetical protein